MREDFQKFMELVKTDEALQKKMKEAGECYSGEKTEEAVFENVIVPIAKEAGYSLTMDDVKQSVSELNLDEMSQVSGGDLGGGFGVFSCEMMFGIGIGKGAGPEAMGICTLIGLGEGSIACLLLGTTGPETYPNPYGTD